MYVSLDPCLNASLRRGVSKFLDWLNDKTTIYLYLLRRLSVYSVRFLIVFYTHLASAAAPGAPAADASRTTDAALTRLYQDQLCVYVVGTQSQEQIGKGQQRVRLAARRERHCARAGPCGYFAPRRAPLVQTALHPLWPSVTIQTQCPLPPDPHLAPNGFLPLHCIWK